MKEFVNIKHAQDFHGIFYFLIYLHESEIMNSSVITSLCMMKNKVTIRHVNKKFDAYFHIKFIRKEKSEAN